ncbi:MAG: GGDEF domain-containing protein, partial [bacterium]|nr:GGDEF domain-containing protein [bacterium]
DELTKLWNRRVFYDVLQMEHDRFERYKSFVCLLYIDIDDFKIYNDRYGHSEGDNVLVQLANVIRNRLRKADIGFRLAGEEFTVLLPGTNTTDALSIAEDIRKLFESIEFRPNNREGSQVCIHKTISIGISELCHDVTSIEFLRMADQAMYRAKREGKNKICLFSNSC